MNFIQRYQPATSWISEFDRLFDRNLWSPELAPFPRESFHESEDAWILRLELPGFAKEDIQLNVTHRTLKLTAETPADRPFGGKVEHEWKLGEAVDLSTITAKLENGILELRLAKVTPVAPEPVRIEIQ